MPGMLAVLFALVAFAGPRGAYGLLNGVGRVPAMGYNTWNRYGCNISEDLVVQTANEMIDLGLQSAGYIYVNLDDCWLLQERTDDGHLQPDPDKFPDGINGTAAKIHALGFHFGIYEDAGNETCAGYAGSLGHESTDADDFASWGVDYLKYDNCNVPSNWYQTTEERYDTMRDALNATGREILFSMCSWGTDSVWTYGNETGNSWRMTGDISASWSSVVGIINQVENLTSYTNFWGHGDEDMLELGNSVNGVPLTLEEQRTHFTTWSLMKSPLLVGTDLSSISNDTVAILTNPDVIAISQDPVVGAAIAPFNYNASNSPQQSWSGDSQNGTVVLLINGGDSTTDVTFSFSDVPELSDSPSSSGYVLYDLWAHESSDCVTTDSYTVQGLASHDCFAAVISPCSTSSKRGEDGKPRPLRFNRRAEKDGF